MKVEIFDYKSYNKTLNFKSKQLLSYNEFMRIPINVRSKHDNRFSFLSLKDFKKQANSALKLKKRHSDLEELNREFFTKSLPKNCKEITSKLLKLSGYGAFLLPFLIDKKESEIEYLYSLAKKEDKKGEMRIPAIAFPFFSQISEEHLKALEPIILSKNKEGGWNYSPSYILDLSEKYDAKEIAIMSKMAEYKVNGLNLRNLAENPHLNHSEIVGKADLLNDLYGDKLQEIEFLSNINKENYFRAKIHKDNNKGAIGSSNYKTVEALIKKDANNASERNNTVFEKVIEDIQTSIKKDLNIFSAEDLDTAVKKVKEAVPNATDAQILRTMQKLTQFASYSSLSKIEKKLDNENVIRIFYKGGLNDIFSYFSRNKYILNLPFYKPVKLGGMFITKEDLNNTEFRDIAKEKSKFSDERFMILEGWSEGVNLFNDNNKLTEKTIEVLKKAKLKEEQKSEYTFNDTLKYVLNSDIENYLKNIGAKYFTVSFDSPATREVILEQMKPIVPKEQIITSTVKALANYYGEKSDKNDIEVKISEYYRDNLNVYSKQRMINVMKQLERKIYEHIDTKGISKDKLYIITPMDLDEPAKSYTIVNKMLAEVMDIPKERQIRTYNLMELPQLPDDAVLVIADDVIASGHSMTNAADYIYQAQRALKDKSILFCPITGAKEGVNYLEDTINALGRKDKDAVIYINDNIHSYEYTADFFIEKENPELNAKIFGQKGCAELGMCTTFPYMAPDNNSELSSYIVKYFTPTDECIKTQQKFLLSKISEDALYQEIFGKDKNDVEKISIVKRTMANILNRILCYL